MDTENNFEPAVVENFDSVINLCEFKPNAYYKFIALVRKKMVMKLLRQKNEKHS